VATVAGLAATFIFGTVLIERSSRSANEVSTPRVNVRPPGTTHTVTEPASRSQPKPSAANSSKHGVSSSSARKLAWAPSGGASSYHVELFRGQSRIFSVDTSRPQVTIPVTWTVGQKREHLEAGEYRWYVWPVFAGVRGSTAVVQSRLTVTTG
jgi:hypothetical protein